VNKEVRSFLLSVSLVLFVVCVPITLSASTVDCYLQISRVTGRVDLIGFHMSGYRVNQALRRQLLCCS
jgi:hypothetical protein